MASGQARRPNFLVIVTDDHGIGDVGCYGQNAALTPNLDRLAASGVRFNQWYANAPVCSASRASILTGKYADRTGVQGALPSQPTFDVPGLRKDEVTFPALLKQAGYGTAAFGKWHVGSAPHSRPLAQGFDQFFGWYSGWLDSYSHRYYQLGSAPGKIFHDLWRNTEEVFEEPAYLTELLAREASAHLAKQKREQPFLMYLAFGAPHYSMMAPKKYLDRFPASMERDRRTHLAMVAAVDDAVGLLLDQLRRQGLEDDTVVFFQADNGATREVRASSTAQPVSRGQQWPLQGLQTGPLRRRNARAGHNAGSRLPETGQVWDRPLMSMDLLPTILTMAGQAERVPATVDGQDIVPVLRGSKQAREDLFWSHNNERAMRQGDWKLIVNPPAYPGEETGAKLWLSNLEADPGEKKNLAGAEPHRVRQMLQKIKVWERYVGIANEANPD
ncbi:MAG: sulfatase-like hydrolase/transferase [Paludibaculum sp.]